MKKLWFLSLLTILAVLLFTSSGALAGTEEANGVTSIPETIKALTNSNGWSGWDITGWVNPRGLQSSSACAFAVVKSGSKNDLLAFGWVDGGWIYKWHNATALPQVEAPILLSELEQNTGFMSYYVVDEEIMETRCIWNMKDDGTWRLEHLYNYYPLMFFDTSVEDALHLYNTGWTDHDIDVWIYGSYQTNLRYFDLNVFPKSVEEAREKLSNPPEIPSGTLSAKKIQFSLGKKYKVFQGPGEEYGQAGNGKAVVSTNDWIQVFGEENGWIFIQYDISSDHMRIGWIDANALPRKATVLDLAFSPVKARTAYEIDLTDDPMNSQISIATIAQGIQVDWLATLGEWAYIESSNVEPIRGFVKIESLTVETKTK